MMLSLISVMASFAFRSSFTECDVFVYHTHCELQIECRSKVYISMQLIVNNKAMIAKAKPDNFTCLQKDILVDFSVVVFFYLAWFIHSLVLGSYFLFEKENACKRVYALVHAVFISLSLSHFFFLLLFICESFGRCLIVCLCIFCIRSANVHQANVILKSSCDGNR